MNQDRSSEDDTLLAGQEYPRLLQITRFNTMFINGHRYMRIHFTASYIISVRCIFISSSYLHLSLSSSYIRHFSFVLMILLSLAT